MSNIIGEFKLFFIIMEAFDLDKDDIYCEIGCGGGALLKMALSRAGQGAAVHHSRDMVELSTKSNLEIKSDDVLHCLTDLLLHTVSRSTSGRITGLSLHPRQ